MYKRHLLQIAILVFAVIFIGFSAWAVPGTFNYQGKLTDPDGVPMDGFYIMEFYLYNAESGGSHLWNEQQNVAVANGIYSIELGKISAFPSNLFDNETLYLEVKVFSTGLGWETLSPRQHLTSTPFTMKAGYAATAGDADTLDGLHTSDLFNTGDDYGRSGVAANLYEGTTTLTDRYVNEGQANSITNGMIVNDTVTSNKIADGAVGTSDLSGNAVTSAIIQDGTIQQSDLSFNVPDGHSLDATDGDPVDVVYVDNNGNVGIGTTSPGNITNSKFEVIGKTTIQERTGVYGIVLDEIPGSSMRIYSDRVDGGGPPARDFILGVYNMGHLNQLVLKNNGNVGIGTTSPSRKLDVAGNVIANAYDYHSDFQLKKNIAGIDDALDKVLALRGVEFEWRIEKYPEKGFAEGRKIGLIAQDVEQVIPEVVSIDNEGYKSVEYGKIVSVLIEAIKAQQAQIEGLKARIEVLEQ